MFLNKIFLLLISIVFMLPGARETANANDSSSPSNNAARTRPSPPKRIPPNKVKPGGGLNASYLACEAENSSLTALVPVENPVLTTRSHPSFLFYIPDEATAIDYAEFSLFTASEKTRVYAAKIEIKNTPGIVKIDLPNAPQYALKAEQPYHWYFTIHCQQSESSVALDVDGWIERESPASNSTSQTENASTDIWYDAIAMTAQNLLTTPEDPAVRDRWLKLLKFIDREHLVDSEIQSITTSTSELSQDNP